MDEKTIRNTRPGYARNPNVKEFTAEIILNPQLLRERAAFGPCACSVAHVHMCSVDRVLTSRDTLHIMCDALTEAVSRFSDGSKNRA